MADSTSILNYGTYSFTGDSGINIYNGNDLFANESSGLIVKNGTSGTSTLSVPLENLGGTIQASTGILSLANGGASTGGTYNAAAGAEIDVTGGQSPTWAGNYTGSGGGNVVLQSGQLGIAAPGATLNFPAGYFEWTGGNLDLAGNTLTNTGSLTFNENGLLRSSVGGGELLNQSAIIASGGAVNMADSTSILNYGTYSFTGDSGINIYNGNDLFANEASGLIVKNGTSGTSTLGVPLENLNGVIQATTGTLSLANNGQSEGGTYNAAAGAEIDITGGQSPILEGTYTGTGAGVVALTSGALRIGALGATFNFPAGLFQWTGGNLNLFGNTLTNLATMTFSSSSLLQGYGGATAGGTLVNLGLIVSEGGSPSIADGVVIDNRSTYEFNGDTDVYLYNGNSMFVNESTGVLRKIAGTGTSSVDVTLENLGGKIEADTGTISLANNGQSEGGNYVALPNAAIDLTGGQSPIFEGTYTGTGGGAIELTGGALRIGPSNATFDFPAGMFQWLAGNLNMYGNTLTNIGTMTFSASALLQGYGGATAGGSLVNLGDIISLANAPSIADGVILNNYGTYDFAGDSNIYLYNGNSMFINEATGVTEKGGGVGTSQVTVPFDNLGGTLDAASGTLSLANSGASEGGTYNAAANAEIDLTGSQTPILEGTYTGTGAGVVALTGGDLRIGTNGATFNFPAGLFQWTGGNLNLYGATLTNTGWIGISTSGLLHSYGGPSTPAAFVNLGTVTQTGGSVSVADGVVITEDAQYNLVGGALQLYNGNSQLVLPPTGQLNVSAGSTLTLGLSLQGGTINVTGGTVSLPGVLAGSAGATLNASPGATISLTGGSSPTYAGYYSGNGGGTILLTGGTLNVGAGGVTFGFTGSTFQCASVFINTQQGDVDNLGTITLFGGGDEEIINDGFFYNFGTVIQTGTGNLSLHSDNQLPTTFVNEPGALLNFTTDSGIVNDYGGQTAFLNEGTILKTGGVAMSTLDVVGAITNQGVIAAQVGTIGFTGGSIVGSGGTLNASAGAAISLNTGGTEGISGTLLGAGAGTITLSSGTLTASANATLNFLGGLFQWTGGQISLAGNTVTNTGQITIPDAASVQLVGPGALVNNALLQQGTATVTLSGNVYLSNTSTGTYQLTGNATIAPPPSTYYYHPAGGTIANTGTLTKTGGSGTAIISVPLSQSGTLIAASGTISLTGGITQFASNALTGGTWVASGGAIALAGSITYSAANVTLGPSSSFAALAPLATNAGSFSLASAAAFTTSGALLNSGTVSLSPGSTLAITGTYSQAATGTLDVQIGGSPTSGLVGHLTSTAAGTLAGTLQAEGVNGYAPVPGTSYAIATFPAISGGFSNTLLGTTANYTISSSISGGQVLLAVSASNSDLVASGVSLSSTNAASGQGLTVTYTVSNAGLATSATTWTDSVFLSSTPTVTSTAILLGRVSHSGTLAAGGSYVGTLATAFPGVLPGSYYVVVEADSGGRVGDSNRPNNIASTAAPLVATVAPAAPGSIQSGTASPGSLTYYEIDLTAGQNVQVTLNSNPAGGAALFSQYATIPTPSSYQQQTYNALSATQQLVISNAQAGPYFIAVYGQGTGASNYSLAVASLSFAVTSVSASQLSNLGASTITISGTGFSAGSTASLVSGRTTIAATSVTFVSAQSLIAHFNLTSAATGTYDVRVTSMGSSASLPSGVTVTTAAPGTLAVSIQAPTAARVSRNYVATLTYRNVGQTDLVAPLIDLRSLTGAQFTLDPNGTPSVSEAMFLAVGKLGPAGILEPGESVSIPIVVLQSGDYVQLTASDITAASTAPMAYAYVSDILTQITGATDNTAVLNKIEAMTGTTWGNYVSMLASNASLLPTGSGDPSSLTTLIKLEYQRAEAALSSSITGTVVPVDPHISVAGRTIEAINSTNPGSTYTAQVLNDGSFIMPSVPAGTYTFSVSGLLVGGTTPPTITVAASTPLTAVTVSATVPSTISGVILGPSGQPVPNAYVHVFQGSTLVGAVTASGTGNYSVTNLVVGTYTVVFSAPGYAQTQTTVTAAVGFTAANLTFTPQASVTGHLLNPDGTPAVGTYVIATQSNASTPMSLFTAVTDSTGNYVLTGLPAGTFNLAFMSPNSNAALLSGVTVSAGQTLSAGSLPLAPTSGISNLVQSLSTLSIQPLTSYPTTPAGTRDGPIYPPGSTDPVASAYAPAVIAAHDYLETVWIPTANLKWGYTDAAIWSQYLAASSLTPPTKSTYGLASDLVQGSTVAAGFEQIDASIPSESSQIDLIEHAVQQQVQNMFADSQLSCDGILNNAGTYVLNLDPSVIPGLITKTGQNLLNLEVDYSGIFNIPGNLAGGIGDAAPYAPGTGIGQQYDDNRHWDGFAVVTLDNNGQVTINYNVNMIVNDTVDFLPGNIGEGIEQVVTQAMSFLETVGQSFDVPFQVNYDDFRFTQQTFAIAVNPPVCPDPKRPTPPATPVTTTTTKTVSSHDPNGIDGASGYIAAGNALPYTVQFQNDPTATAPAQTVTVSEQIDPNLDYSTFQFGMINFGTYTVSVPAGLTHYSTQIDATSTRGVYVDVTADFNRSTGLATWTFTSIDPNTLDLPADPTVGFLPPDTDASSGEGFVNYTVSPKAALPNASTIGAQASVVFDTNAPIATAALSATLDTIAPTSSVSALPAQSYANVPVRWSGTDVGSGVASYTIYVSDNGGAFTPWLTDTTATSGTYSGTAGHLYAFYSVATDAVGNVQPTPSAAQASTTAEVITRTVAFSGKLKATYTDALGHLVTLSLSGPGTGVLSFFTSGPADPVLLTLSSTTSKSTLTFTTKSKAVTTLSDIEVTGSLAKISAAPVNLAGKLSVTGTLGGLTLDNVTGTGSTIAIDGPGVATTYSIGAIQGLTLTSAAPIKSFAATSWTPAGGFADTLTAPAATTISIKGATDVGLSLTSPAGAVTFSAASITGATWTIAGAVKSLRASAISASAFNLGSLASMTVAGALSGTTVRSTGSVGAVSVGSISASGLYVGVSNGQTGLVSTAASLGGATLKSFADKTSFAGSFIDADVIDSLTLKGVAPSNGGTPFGATAHLLKSGSAATAGRKTYTVSAKTPASALPSTFGDLKIQLV
jgi:hypothetical protein